MGAKHPPTSSPLVDIAASSIVTVNSFVSTSPVSDLGIVASAPHWLVVSLLFHLFFFFLGSATVAASISPSAGVQKARSELITILLPPLITALLPSPLTLPETALATSQPPVATIHNWHRFYLEQSKSSEIKRHLRD